MPPTQLTRHSGVVMCYVTQHEAMYYHCNAMQCKGNDMTHRKCRWGCTQRKPESLHQRGQCVTALGVARCQEGALTGSLTSHHLQEPKELQQQGVQPNGVVCGMVGRAKKKNRNCISSGRQDLFQEAQYLHASA